MSSPPDNVQPREQCRLAEILQYKCVAEDVDKGQLKVHCLPIPRIFRICPNRPAVEMTRFVDVDLESGAVHIPAPSSQVLPKAKPWRDVVRYDNPFDNGRPEG
ncbi:hypothetical protein BD309DRAFT_864292 [Dichomitus squalens]|uniref:uncharacterized protein n=1 Tax=Dichomitus squalens (strain LYAD-421) TaxID=732165 RepID=UPI00044116AF|nr:uncharacterized protein DICSQDRAFT_54719 [Dichomitus squalens LYAD-421 SS1]EJF63814.1 hypothetical protein DICSQDRAFT_54719 [Dichomitus squalens LYAD-421 SS1]TBU43465.1 hypothetical protein BD309DRAFT_864292 [Dichomitus squalens]